MRFFTTEGPVNCADHYCLPPLSRLDMEDVLALIAQQKYFLLHAPRQTGKTTCLLALADYLNAQGEYQAVYANIEAAQAWREDVEQGMATTVSYIANFAAERTGDSIAVPAPVGGERVVATIGLRRSITPPALIPVRRGPIVARVARDQGRFTPLPAPACGMAITVWGA